MLTVKTNTSQYDTPITKIATYLYNKLVGLGINADDISGYDRVYRFKDKKGFKPYYYVSNKDYKEVLFNDKKALMFFFGVSDEIKYDAAWGEVDVHLIFTTDISKMPETNDYRADIEVRKDIFDIIRAPHRGFTLLSEVVGFEKTFSEYNGLKESDMPNFDMHPKHCFRYNFNLRFPINYSI